MPGARYARRGCDVRRFRQNGPPMLGMPREETGCRLCAGDVAGGPAAHRAVPAARCHRGDAPTERDPDPHRRPGHRHPPEDAPRPRPGRAGDVVRSGVRLQPAVLPVPRDDPHRPVLRPHGRVDERLRGQDGGRMGGLPLARSQRRRIALRRRREQRGADGRVLAGAGRLRHGPVRQVPEPLRSADGQRAADTDRMDVVALVHRRQRWLLRLSNRRRRRAPHARERPGGLLDRRVRATGTRVPALAEDPGWNPAVLPVLLAVRPAHPDDPGPARRRCPRAGILRVARVQRARRVGQATVRSRRSRCSDSSRTTG